MGPSWNEQTRSRYLHPTAEKGYSVFASPFWFKTKQFLFYHHKSIFSSCKKQELAFKGCQRHHEKRTSGGLLLVLIMPLSACCAIFIPPASWARRVRARSLFGAAVHEPCLLCALLQRYVLQPAQMAWKKAWAVETNPRHQPGGSLGDIMVEQTHCSHCQTPALLPLQRRLLCKFFKNIFKKYKLIIHE